MPAWMWYSVLSQLISRALHPDLRQLRWKGKGGKGLERWCKIDQNGTLRSVWPIRSSLKAYAQHHSHIVLSGANNPGFLTKLPKWVHTCTLKNINFRSCQNFATQCNPFVSVCGIGRPWNERQVDHPTIPLQCLLLRWQSALWGFGCSNAKSMFVQIHWHLRKTFSDTSLHFSGNHWIERSLGCRSNRQFSVLNWYCKSRWFCSVSHPCSDLENGSQSHELWGITFQPRISLRVWQKSALNKQPGIWCSSWNLRRRTETKQDPPCGVILQDVLVQLKRHWFDSYVFLRYIAVYVSFCGWFPVSLVWCYRA